MSITLVPDPTYKGKGTPPMMVKAEAMRRLYASGESVSAIALRYGVSYYNAYGAINPPRKSAASGQSTAVKLLTPERATQLSKTRLIAIATAKQTTPDWIARKEAASDELDRRYPGWLDKLFQNLGK